MKKNILLLFAVVLALTTTAYADFYTWTDKDGTTHITDYPPPQDKQGQNIKIYKGDDREQDAPKTSTSGKKSEIILFTKNQCPDCDQAREFLKAQSRVFTEYNMDADENAINKRKEFDESSDVPFAIINRIQVYGFSETVYTRAIKSIP